MDRPVYCRDALAGRRSALASDTESFDPPSDRRYRHGADDVSSGAARRQPKLGLSLLLAARRDLHALRAFELRISRRGKSLAFVADARVRHRPGRPAHYVPR